MQNKRGLSFEFLVLAILALVIMGFGLYFVTKGGFLVSSNYNQYELQAKTQSCEAKAAYSTTFFDNDYGNNQGDQVPDSCEICLGGNNKNDADNDGMPNACDNDPTNPPEKGMTMSKICTTRTPSNTNPAGTWDEKKFQCTLKTYGKSKPNTI